MSSGSTWILQLFLCHSKYLWFINNIFSVKFNAPLMRYIGCYVILCYVCIVIFVSFSIYMFFYNILSILCIFVFLFVFLIFNSIRWFLNLLHDGTPDMMFSHTQYVRPITKKREWIKARWDWTTGMSPEGPLKDLTSSNSRGPSRDS